MKAAKLLGGLVLGCMALGVACSSDEHQLGAELPLYGTPHCEDLGKAEGRNDIRSYCAEFTYDNCPNGSWTAKYTWGPTPRWTCGDDPTLGCCLDLGFGMGLVDGVCNAHGGQCLPYTPDGCPDGLWLPRSAANCGDGQVCCARTSCVQGHAGQCLPFLPDGCPDGRWLPPMLTDCAEGQSCCAPWPAGGQ